MGKPWIQAQHQQGQGRASSPLLPPTLSALFCGHRWPSEPWPFVFTECWRSYRTEQRAVVRSAQSRPCFLEKPLGGACSPNRVRKHHCSVCQPPWVASTVASECVVLVSFDGDVKQCPTAARNWGFAAAWVLTFFAPPHGVTARLLKKKRKLRSVSSRALRHSRERVDE